jgi:hypothetical protein
MARANAMPARGVMPAYSSGASAIGHAASPLTSPRPDSGGGRRLRCLIPFEPIEAHSAPAFADTADWSQVAAGPGSLASTQRFMVRLQVSAGVRGSPP